MRNVGRVCAVLCLVSCVCAWAGSYSLWEFDAAYAPDCVSMTDAAVSYKQKAMTIRTGHERDWPGVTLAAPKKKWDLSKFSRVSLDVENLSSETVKVYLRVDDPKADGTKHCLTGSVELVAGGNGTIMTKLSSTPWVLDEPLELIGMRGYPMSQEVLDTSTICRVLVFVAKPQVDYTFRISNLRAEGNVTTLEAGRFIPFIDEYGQFIHADWPGKVDSAEGMDEQRKKEEADLSAHPGPGDWNQYGGWKKGPQLKASGFFRVEKQNGQWWLVDPEGRLFWSHGTDCVWTRVVTPITDRENYFAWLPKEGQAFSEFYGQGNWAPHGYYQGKGTYRTFDFGSSNLQRKYGKDFYDAYAMLCHRRLRSWGMNTIGNWSDLAIKMKRKTPYVGSIHFTSRVIEGSEGYWGKFYDVFDPAFREAFRKQLENRKGQSVNDPWCLGFFVHNELAWGDDVSLAVAALVSGADQPAKIKFVEVLKGKYGEIEKLNKAWGAEYASWADVLQKKVKPDVEKARQDLTDFYTVIAETYFKTIRDELKAAAPKQLYLGCRFAWVNDLAARAAAKYCDVVSYNRYVHRVDDLRMPEGLDKPLIIGEFHFGALDRGMFHTGLVSCVDQADRAQKYREYVFGALRNPNLVGTHWFQYRDQATTGRGDGENYQIGLVDICDRPYPETIEAVRQVGDVLYEYRYHTSQIK